ncbi:MAG: site-specific integrase, partial [Flavobacterium sp.]
MHKSESLKIFVFAKRKKNQEAVAHLYYRIFLENRIIEKSLKIKCPFDKWDVKSTSILDDQLLTLQLQQKLEVLKQKLQGAYFLIRDNSEEVNLKELVEMANKKEKPKMFSFCKTFEEVIERMEKSCTKGAVSATNVRKHKNCFNHLRKFVRQYYKLNDFPFSKINKQFIESFVEYLKTDGKCSHNTAMKVLSIFKKVYRIGIDNSWVKNNAFSNYKIRLEYIEKEFLTEEELKVLMEKEILIPRLDLVRDIFIFSCFTGMAYIDVMKLKRENVMENHGMHWFKIYREKTHVKASIPILEPARLILTKYSPRWLTADPKTKLIPILSNQKMNAYLT